MPVLPDPRLEAPELLYPGRKPTGPVKIDRTQPITDSLMIYGLVQDMTNAGCHNPADESTPGTTFGTPVSGDAVRIRPEGYSVWFHPNGNLGFEGLEFQNNRFTTTDVTFYSDYMFIAGVAGTHWRWGPSGSWCFSSGVNETVAQVSYVDASPAQHNAILTFESAIDVYDRVRLVGRKRGSRLDVWARVRDDNHLQHATITSGDGTLRSYQSNVLRAADGDADTFIFNYAAFNKALSDDEVEKLMMDPYHFLMPA